MSDRSLQDSVDNLLLLQNPDGGTGCYEPKRGGEFLELLNSAEIIDNIMIEYSFPECTSSVITALTLFQRHFPMYRSAEVSRSISRALTYLNGTQRKDGSWFGVWAVCFTYAIFFALESLETAGETWQTSARVRAACAWLVKHQMEDGGWGEDFRACETGEYVQHEKSQVVNTSWAVLALMRAQYPERSVINRGLEVSMHDPCLPNPLLTLKLTTIASTLADQKSPTIQWRVAAGGS